MPDPSTLPLISPLPAGFCIQSAFGRLSHFPGVLWLDSASQPSDVTDAPDLGRYSFLTADPIETLTANWGDANPWPKLEKWYRELPSVSATPGGPPFQGGIAGVIGYESGAWLENIGITKKDDFPTPALSLGLYDWTIAVDHATQQAWIVSQGITQRRTRDARLAEQRLQQIRSLVEDCCVVESVSETTMGDAPDLQRVTSNFTSKEFRAAVAEVVRRICAGDSFQVNLAQRLLRKSDSASPELYLRLRESNPAPFGGFYDGGSFSVLSSSPERFLMARDRDIETRPIKGTTSRTGDPETDADLAQRLRESEKDRAENVMIVDLMRNDLSRVCENDSVRVRKLCGVERYQYVQHLVSVVEGRLRTDQTVIDLLMACFPGGSVTGAPKIEAMKTISELEPHPRGPYCGSMGYISFSGTSDWNILIRTITETGGYCQIPVGGGITARSNPEAEEAETWIKAKGMLRAFDAEACG